MSILSSAKWLWSVLLFPAALLLASCALTPPGVIVSNESLVDSELTFFDLQGKTVYVFSSANRTDTLEFKENFKKIADVLKMYQLKATDNKKARFNYTLDIVYGVDNGIQHITTEQIPVYGSTTRYVGGQYVYSTDIIGSMPHTETYITYRKWLSASLRKHPQGNELCSSKISNTGLDQNFQRAFPYLLKSLADNFCKNTKGEISARYFQEKVQ